MQGGRGIPIHALETEDTHRNPICTHIDAQQNVGVLKVCTVLPCCPLQMHPSSPVGNHICARRCPVVLQRSMQQPKRLKELSCHANAGHQEVGLFFSYQRGTAKHNWAPCVLCMQPCRPDSLEAGRQTPHSQATTLPRTRHPGCSTSRGLEILNVHKL